MEDLKIRTKRFAIAVIKLTEAIPKSAIGNVISKQILRSATSVGANYRSACRAKSPADFISKMGTVEEEADETIYWLELLQEVNLIGEALVKPLISEADEILSIVIASIKTARQRKATQR
jgi:four helix bundle protein